MLPYYLLCKKTINTESINPLISKTKTGGTMILSKCAICGTKKSRFIKKKQEVKRFLSNVGLKTPFSKTLILGDVLF